MGRFNFLAGRICRSLERCRQSPRLLFRERSWHTSATLLYMRVYPRAVACCRLYSDSAVGSGVLTALRDQLQSNIHSNNSNMTAAHIREKLLALIQGDGEAAVEMRRSLAFWNLCVQVETHELNETAALDRVEQMIAAGISPQRDTFLLLLHMYSQLDQPERGIAVFEEMLQRGVLPDAEICAVVISMFLLGLNDPNRALQLLQYMADQSMEAPLSLVSKLIQYYAQQSDVETVFKLIRVLTDEVQSNTSHTENLTSTITECAVLLIELFGRCNRTQDMLVVFKALQRHPVLLTLQACLSLFESLIMHSNKHHLAFRVLHQLISRAEIVPTRGFCFQVAGLLANREVLVSLEYLRYFASLAAALESNRISDPKYATARLLHYLQPGFASTNSERLLSHEETQTFLQDIRTWTYRLAQRRRNTPLDPNSRETDLPAV